MNEPKFKRNQSVIYRGKVVTVSSVDEGFEGRTDYEVKYEGGIDGGIQEHELAPAPAPQYVTVATSELNSQPLDWAVAKVLGRDIRPGRWRGKFSSNHGIWQPSTNWTQCGPLIAKHAIGFAGHDADNWLAFASPADEEHQGVGPTHLVAACRLIVRAALGETVSIPAELVQAVQP